MCGAGSRTPTIRRPALRTRLDLRRSGFLAGAAVGHHLGAIILVSSAWTSPAALAWSLPSRSSRLAHLGWMAASLVITQAETCQRRRPPRTPGLELTGGHNSLI
jgi:hypothetical protein